MNSKARGSSYGVVSVGSSLLPFSYFKIGIKFYKLFWSLGFKLSKVYCRENAYSKILSLKSKLPNSFARVDFFFNLMYTCYVVCYLKDKKVASSWGYGEKGALVCC